MLVDRSGGTILLQVVGFFFSVGRSCSGVFTGEVREWRRRFLRVAAGNWSGKERKENRKGELGFSRDRNYKARHLTAKK